MSPGARFLPRGVGPGPKLIGSGGMAYRDAHVNAMASVDLPPSPRELSAAPGNKVSTLDPDARTLLQVKVDDMVEADDLFTKLMGDVVEPRREFIQQNALNVENLDF